MTVCGVFERKEMIYENQKSIIFELDTAIKKSQVHHWSLKIKIYMIYLYRVSKNVLYTKMQNFKNFYYNKDNRIW